MESLFIEAWTKACPKDTQHLIKSLDAGTVWYYKYLEAMVQLTNSMEHVFHGHSANVIKVMSYFYATIWYYEHSCFKM